MWLFSPTTQTDLLLDCFCLAYRVCAASPSDLSWLLKYANDMHRAPMCTWLLPNRRKKSNIWQTAMNSNTIWQFFFPINQNEWKSQRRANTGVHTLWRPTRSNANTASPVARSVPGSVKVNNAQRSPKLSPPPPPPDVPGSSYQAHRTRWSFTLRPRDLPLRLNFDSDLQPGRCWTCVRMDGGQASALSSNSGTGRSLQSLPEIPLNSCKKLFTSAFCCADREQNRSNHRTQSWMSLCRDSKGSTLEKKLVLSH